MFLKKTVMQEELRSQVDPSFRDILAEGDLDFGKRGLPRKYGVRQIPDTCLGGWTVQYATHEQGMPSAVYRGMRKSGRP